MEKKNIEAVLFDLDGTLLPLEQNIFSKQYFTALIPYATNMGVPKETFIVGIEKMLKNDGSRTNADAFWNTYEEITGKKRDDIEERLADFYYTEFKKLRQYTFSNAEAELHARQMVDAARRNGKKVIVATNPVLPMIAHIERLSWIGLKEEDFELITGYENSMYCKPNPKYYIEICEKIGVAPENCLMIGNDESDDMKGASAAGMLCFLVTDHRIMAEHFVWTGERGSFEQAVKMLERI